MGLGFGIRDPRSGIRNKPIPDPGYESGSATREKIIIKKPVILPPFMWVRMYWAVLSGGV
jgi:hypothetical protein